MVNFTYSGVFVVNFEHNSHLVRREVFRNASFTLEKRKESNKFNRLQIEVFFLPITSPHPLSSSRVYKPPNIGQSNLSFVRIYAQGLLIGTHSVHI